MNNRRPTASLRRLAMLSAALILTVVPNTQASTDDVSWSPRASERLIKLPSNFLKRAIEQDYANSALSSAVKDTDEKMRFKVKTLEELRGAIEQAAGDLRIELRHQFLAEKQAYLKLVSNHQKFRRKHAQTKIRIYKNLLGKIKREDLAMTPQRAALIEKQEVARNRFRSSIAQVDAKLFRSPLMKESKYSREYAKNLAAIEHLVQAVNAHPANVKPNVDGVDVSREDFLRQLINDNEATIAVLNQERSILGYMAKLIALDATVLSEAVNEDEVVSVVEEHASYAGVSGAVKFFIK